MFASCHAGLLAGRNICALALFCAIAATPAKAGGTVVIDTDLGGNIQEYQARARNFAGRGVRVVIRGECQSACSLFLGLPGACVEPDAVIRLHAATWIATVPQAGMVRGETSPGATRQLIASYPRRLKVWIARHGGLTRNWLVLERQELLTVLPSCSKQAPTAPPVLAQTVWRAPWER